MLATVVTVWIGAQTAVVPAASPMSEGEAEQILQLPRGSVSTGTTGTGRLVGARAMPRRGEGWAFLQLVRERKTYYATDEMAGLLERAAARVARKYRRSVLRLGNIATRRGGPIQWSVSHRNGRDADMLFYALTRGGRRTTLNDFVRFGRDGRDEHRKYRFDTARNLELVRALLEDEQVSVQWILVARWLKKKLLRRAQRKGLPAELIRRMEAVLRQPSDSTPHDDHFHVRIYCSLEDRLHGCHDRAPYHAWVDRADDKFNERVDRLVEVLSLPRPELRRRAVERLRAMRARRAVDALVARLDDQHEDVRRAAYKALRTIGQATAVPGILAALGRVEDPEWAAELFDLIGRLGTRPTLAALALRVLREPATCLTPTVIRSHPKELQLRAIAVLKTAGRKEAFPPLEALLESRHREVRQAAHEALLRITNQRVRGDMRSRRESVRERVRKSWREFWEQHRTESWLQWMRLGFEARGYEFRGRMMSRDGVPTLLSAVGCRDKDAAYNANRVLSQLTGHQVDPERRSRRGNLRYWRKWWRRNRSGWSAN